MESKCQQCERLQRHVAILENRWSWLIGLDGNNGVIDDLRKKMADHDKRLRWLEARVAAAAGGAFALVELIKHFT